MGNSFLELRFSFTTIGDFLKLACQRDTLYLRPVTSLTILWYDPLPMKAVPRSTADSRERIGAQPGNQL